jgi:hypothetical protein
MTSTEEWNKPEFEPRKSLFSTPTLRYQGWKHPSLFPNNRKITLCVDGGEVSGFKSTIIRFLNQEFQSVFFQEIDEIVGQAIRTPVLVISCGDGFLINPALHRLIREMEDMEAVGVKFPLLHTNFVSSDLFTEPIGDKTYPLLPIQFTKGNLDDHPFPTIRMIVEVPEVGGFYLLPRVGDEEITSTFNKVNTLGMIAISQWMARALNAPELKIPRSPELIDPSHYVTPVKRGEAIKKNWQLILQSDSGKSRPFIPAALLHEPVYDMQGWFPEKIDYGPDPSKSLKSQGYPSSEYTPYVFSSSSTTLSSSSEPSSPSSSSGSDSAKRQRLQAQIQETQTLLGAQMQELRRINMGEVQPGFSLHA